MAVDVVKEAASNYRSALAFKYSVAEAQRVCDGVASWIVKLLGKHKGVVVPGLGTFTLSEWALNTGLGKPLIICRPVFFLAESLVQAFSIRQRQVFASNTMACHMIHYGGVASLSGLERTKVKDCVKEVTQALKRLLWQSEDIILHLGELGVLHVQDKEVNFEFSKEVTDKVNALTESRRITTRPVYPWSPKRILD